MPRENGVSPSPKGGEFGNSRGCVWLVEMRCVERGVQSISGRGGTGTGFVKKPQWQAWGRKRYFGLGRETVEHFPLSVVMMTPIGSWSDG